MNTPIVGTIFTVPRKQYDDTIQDVEYRVTSIRQGKIYYRDTRWGSDKRQRPVGLGIHPEAKIVSVPDKAKFASVSNPKLGKRQIDSLFSEAHSAGMAAGTAARPVPMIVERHAHPLDDSSPVEQSWYEEGGVCGFASVRFPANTTFAHRLIERGLAKKSYTGGAYIWVNEFGQSMQRKEAYAHAFANVLTKAGIQKVHAESRMD